MAGPDEIYGQETWKIYDEQLQRILDIWNARINPPDRPSTLGDIIFNTKKLQTRNNKVIALKEAERNQGKESEAYVKALEAVKTLEKHPDFPFFKLKLDSTEEYTIEAVNKRQKDFATDSFREYTPIDQNKAVTYVDELASEIDRKRVEAGYESNLEQARYFVYNNLFYNWKLDKAGNARMTDRVERDIVPRDIPAFQVIEGSSRQLEVSREVAANYMTLNDLYLKALLVSVERGLYPPEIMSMLRKGGVEDADEATRILESMGITIDRSLIDPGSYSLTPVGQLDDIISQFNTSLLEMIQGQSQDIRYSANPVHFMENLASKTIEDVGGPEDNFPRLAENEKLDQQLYLEWTGKDWDFNKDISHNIKSLMAKEVFDREVDAFGDETLFWLDPNSSSWPKTLTELGYDKSDIKAEVAKAQRLLIAKLEETSEGKAYIAALNDRTANPSLEQAFTMYRLYRELMEPVVEEGEASADFMDTVKAKLKHNQNSTFRNKILDDENGSKARENFAKEYLSRSTNEGVRDRYKEKHFKPLIDKLTQRIFNYANFEEMRKDADLEAEIINDYNEIVKSRPFDADITTIKGRQKALEALLQKELTESQYARYDKASDNTKQQLAAKLATYENQSQAMDDPEFLAMLFEIPAEGVGPGGAIWEGSQNIAKEREEKEAKARAKKLTAEERDREKRIDDLNKNLFDSIFDEFVTRGIVGLNSSPEYLDHIRNTIVPQMVNRTEMGGGVTAIEDISTLVDKAVGQPDRAGRFTGGYLNMFDVSESDFIRQMVPTAEDLPPGVTPQMIAKPTPAFDISQFAPQLTELAFDRPEFASFLQSEAQKPEFQKMWQKASEPTPRRDRAAEIQLQEERLASFQRAAEREPTEANLAALERAQAQFARETGAVSPVYEKYTDPVTGQERSKLTGEVSPTAMKAPGFFQSGRFDPVRGKWIDNLADIRKTLVKPGKTQRQFFESQLPGFERRFEASPFFKQKEERLKRQTEIEEEKKREADEEAESDRRTLLRSGRGGGVGSARTIFRRGRI